MLLETRHLQLREYNIEDAPFILELMNTEGWLKYIGDRNIHSIDDAKAYIKKHYLGSYEKHGFGAYIVSLKGEGIPIGSCGLYKRDNLEHPDIGFAFLPAYSKKGYGYESSSALMKYAKNKLKIDTILGFTVYYNDASIRLLEKLGLQQIDTYKFKDDPEELLLFSN